MKSFCGFVLLTRAHVRTSQTHYALLPNLWYSAVLVVKAYASGAEDPGFESRLRQDFSGSSHTSGLKSGTPGATLQAPGIVGSAVGLVGPVSVYCDWVR